MIKKTAQRKPRRKKSPELPAWLVPPPTLPIEARALWDRFGVELRRAGMSELDVPAFERYCSDLYDWRLISAKLRDLGWFYTSESQHGKMHRSHPLEDSLEKRVKYLQWFEREFPMTPSTRAEISRRMASLPVPAGDLFAGMPQPVVAAVDQQSGQSGHHSTEPPPPESPFNFIPRDRLN